jgi:hypothetical protein
VRTLGSAFCWLLGARVVGVVELEDLDEVAVWVFERTEQPVGAFFELRDPGGQSNDFADRGSGGDLGFGEGGDGYSS